MARTSVPSDHSEFGGGDGLIDSERRKDRVVTPEEERMEVMFTNPYDPESDPATVELGTEPATREWPKETRRGTA